MIVRPCHRLRRMPSKACALAADLLATAYETVAYTWITSPVGVQMEVLALDWLKQMFELPKNWGGVMVTGASMANCTCTTTRLGS